MIDPNSSPLKKSSLSFNAKTYKLKDMIANNLLDSIIDGKLQFLDLTRKTGLLSYFCKQ